MPRLRIWHILVAVAAAGLLFAVARLDYEVNYCSPVSPILASAYVCCLLGIRGARWRGRRGITGFWLGVLLGPIGVIIACSNFVSQDWPDPKAKTAASDRLM